jgi:c-di-GMP-binding flagellar brake protein YcgR
MRPRKDRRFKQWNKASIKPAMGGRDPEASPGSDGFTYDISLGGARIHSAERFEEGAVLKLQIELVRSHETISLEGLVKWIKHNDSEDVFELGVEFLHLNSVTVLSLMRDLHGEKV